MTSKRALLLIVLPLLILAVPAVAIALFSDQLPNRLATHWNGSTPDGSMTLTTLILFAGATLVLPGLAISSAGVVASRRLPKGGAAMAVFLGIFLASLGSLIITSTVISQRGLENWTDASVIGVLPVLVISPLTGAAGSFLARSLPHNEVTHEVNTGDQPTMAITHAERLVFIETQTVTWALGLSFAAAVSAITLAVLGFWSSALGALALTIPGLLMGRVRVQADRNGLSVRSAIIPIRYAKVGLPDIEAATVIDVEPMKWGGWGYRGSLKLAGTAAIVTRRGPGLRLDLVGDRQFAVTIDDPTTPARLLNALRPTV